MESAVVYLVITLVPALALLVPTQYFRMRSRVRASGESVGTTRLLVIALVTVLAGLAIGVAFGIAVLAGPSYVTGASNNLFWFTMLPAFGIGILAASVASRVIGTALINRFVSVPH